MTQPQSDTLPLAGGVSALSRRIAALELMTLDDLRAEWRRVVKTSPHCRLSPDLLRRGVAHRLQEAAFGSCSRQTARKLAAALQQTKTSTSADPLKTGTTLLREWHGRTYTVRVREAGFDYDGRSFVSLSAIAREITGAAWSGPRFFGLAASTRYRSGAEQQGG